MPNESPPTANGGVAPSRDAALDMFEKHRPFAHIVAEELYRPTTYHDREDCAQTALTALWEACLDFDGQRGTKPTTHIRWKVRSAITDWLRRTGRRKRKREAGYRDMLLARQRSGTWDMALA
jgi:RNA polymerase sigma factor (sigma-70 family)